MDYKLLKLEPYSTAKDNLFFWIKHYYVWKFTNAKIDKDKELDDFDLSALCGKMLSNTTDTMDDKVISIVNKASKSLVGVNASHSTYRVFYPFIEKSKEIASIKDIDQNCIKDFILKESHKESEATKKRYYVHLKALFNFIQEHNIIPNTDKPFMFNIGKDKHGKAEPILRTHKGKKTTIFLNTKQLKKLDADIVKYEYDDDFDKAMEILIIRLFIYSMISTSELIKIKDTDFVEVENDKTTLELELEDRVIPLPRARLIKYINLYRKHNKCRDCKYFFCSRKTQTPINIHTINKIIKKHFENSSIKSKQQTAEVLKNSGAIFMYRQGISDKKLQQLLGHKTLQTTRRLLDAGNTDHYTVADLFVDFGKE